MIFALLIIAIGALLLLHTDRQAQKKIIEQKNYHIRHLTGNLNESDLEEKKNLLDDYHFGQILRALKEEYHLPSFGNDFFMPEALMEFKRKYGYPFTDPFNKYGINRR